MDREKASNLEDWSPLGPDICKSIPTLEVVRQRAVLYKLIPLSPRKLSLPARKLPPTLHWGGGEHPAQLRSSANDAYRKSSVPKPDPRPLGYIPCLITRYRPWLAGLPLTG